MHVPTFLLLSSCDLSFFPLSLSTCTGTGKAALTRADKKRLKAQREADIAAAELH
jgi:hypothetical protein